MDFLLLHGEIYGQWRNRLKTSQDGHNDGTKNLANSISRTSCNRRSRIAPHVSANLVQYVFTIAPTNRISQMMRDCESILRIRLKALFTTKTRRTRSFQCVEIK
jgi:hypothetical protein